MPLRARAILVLVILAGGFTVISFNLIQIQLVEHAKYWQMAEMNHMQREVIPSKRGAILDSEGSVLAQTQTTTDVAVDGKLLDHPAEQLTQIAQILQIPAAPLIAGFDARKRHVDLAQNIDDNTVTKLRALKLNSLIFDPRDLRLYPNNELAAHILGFTDETGHGAAGVEKEMDTLLSGMPGERYVERDARKKVIAAYATRETPAVDGCNVTLTVNSAIQHVVESELDQIVQTYQPHGAYIVVMDPHTGEILGMGSRPTYDPNDSKTFKPEAVANRCITDAVEPGSVFKIVTLAAALNEGHIDLQTPVFCQNGQFLYGGKILRDDEAAGFGWLPVIEVMAQSSNIGFAEIALNYLGEQKLYKYATAFGIGQRTGILKNQGESAGILHPVDKWSAISITRIPMGQEVAATPIQMATAMSVIANGGNLMTPHLVKQVTDDQGRVVQVYSPHVVRRVISPDVAQDVAKALRQVTIDGTAKHISIDGYSFAGKTGTAQKLVNGEYSHTQHVASFIGFLPARDPAFVALVMVDDPKTTKYYGAEVSAPVFASLSKQVAQILNVPPDLPPTVPALTSNTTR
jgi:cell division protein FtsI/penicillin-binding protein 2